MLLAMYTFYARDVIYKINVIFLANTFHATDILQYCSNVHFYAKDVFYKCNVVSNVHFPCMLRMSFTNAMC